MNTILCSRLEVESVLNTLFVGKASGPNDLSNRILSELSTELSIPFCSLFHQSLRTGTFPAEYKKANVCPVPKNVKCQLSLIIYLYPYSTPKVKFSRESSLNTYLITYKTITFAFLLTVWFKNYLADRKQRVVLPNVTSDWTVIRAGVPQGSILGPLLFLLYINDIVNDIGSNIRLFADDTSLFIIIDNPVTAAEYLNSDLNKLSRWTATWHFTFNPSKTKALLFFRKLRW